jgi:formate/nitrite transporter FocA (FNT family)
MGKEISDYTAQKVQEEQKSLLKKINSGWLTGVVAGIFAGVLMAYVNWESTGRQEKLTQYIASSLLFSSLISICALAGASLGVSHAFKRKFESPKNR